MDNTTTWIMVALLVLLIAAAIFVLLRRPGGDRDSALDTEEPSARQREVPQDRAGTQDRAAQDQAAVEAHSVAPEQEATEVTSPADVADQADRRDPGVIQAHGAVIGAEGVVPEGTGREDEGLGTGHRADRDREDEPVVAEPVATADDTRTDPIADEPRTHGSEEPTSAGAAEPVDQGRDAGHDRDADDSRRRDAAAIGAMGAAGAGAHAAARPADSIVEQERTTHDAPVPDNRSVQDEATTPVFREAPPLDENRDDRYQDVRDVPDEPTEHPVEPPSTTYRADQGQALTVDEEGQLGYVDEHQGNFPESGAPTMEDSRRDSTTIDRDRSDTTDFDDRTSTSLGQTSTVDEHSEASPTGTGAGATAVDPDRRPTGTGAPVVDADQPLTDTDATDADQRPSDTRDEAPIFTESIYGAGSAEPLEDGTGPAGWEIKGNAGSMLFHTPESPSYDGVRAEVWFESEEAARAAGFAHWNRRRR